MIRNIKMEESGVMYPSMPYVAPFVRVTSIAGQSSFMLTYGSGNFMNEEDKEGEWADE